MRLKFRANIQRYIAASTDILQSSLALQEKDSNQNFVRIQKFAPKFENCRTHGSCWRRFTIHGNDNSKTSFSVQLPAPRFFRREDKVTQVLRTFNRCVLTIAVDTPKLNLGVKCPDTQKRKQKAAAHFPSACDCFLQPRTSIDPNRYVIHCSQRHIRPALREHRHHP